METNTYLKNLKTLQRIRDIAGGHNLNLPQICVVGDQSAGKSSVLKLLTGVNFPVDSGTCTKCAIVVECKQDDTERFEIQNNNGQYESTSFDTMANRIIEIQQSFLALSGRKKISVEEIKVKVYGPNMIDIIVVDLPGIINVGDGQHETRELIKDYIKPVETLILLVSEAKQDKELITAVELASEFDQNCERTIHIYTKFDTFDSDESKNRAIQWVFDGRDLKLGGHAVVAAPGGKTYDSGEEFDLLKGLDLPKNRSGIESLKERLPPIFAKLIATNLPRLFEMINLKLKSDRKELEKIGDAPKNPMLTVKLCQERLLEEIPNLHSLLSPLITNFNDIIFTYSNKITPEWTSRKFPPNAFICPFFAGKDAFLQCLIEITEWWSPVLNAYTTKVEGVINSFTSTALKEKIELAENLKLVINSHWKIFANSIIESMKMRVKEELIKFKTFGTVNHHLTAKFEGELYVPEELVEKFIESISSGDFKYSVEIGVKRFGDPVTEPCDVVDVKKTKKNLREKLEGVRNDFEEDFKRMPLHEQQQKRLLAAVLATYKVESKTFIDMVFKATTNLVGEVQHWAMNILMKSEEILTAANENEDIAQKRVSLKDHLEKMNKCLKELTQIM